MTEHVVKIINRAGIHARPAAVLVNSIKDLKANVYLEKGHDRINAKSIMGILTLLATYGTELKVVAEGEEEEVAVETIVRLIETKFEEE
ncbi:MAG: HPr family phosphocarrier protein [Treponema sp.]|jgi:phosphocarrier protein|nr:HPr family phosphocarrier protein [Treponema sp.]